jgi:antitoxin component YwqK of YwqJK toxin-antitoxin module
LRYHPNTRIESKSFYKNGQLDGPLTIYDEDGNKVSVETYKNGILDGLFESYFIDGKPRIQGQYKDGLYEGEWKYYDDMGFIIGKGKYEAGTGTQMAFHLNGNTMREIEYVKNQKHGQDRFYDKQGKISRIDTYENGDFVKTEVVRSKAE